MDRTIDKRIENAPEDIRSLYYSVRNYILVLGDGIVENELKMYVAFKKIKNIICVEVYQKSVVLYVKLSPDEVELEIGFTSDMRGIGHSGTGDLEIVIKDIGDFEKAKVLIDKVYENN